MKCEFCEQEASAGSLCERHSLAEKNLLNTYKQWVQAFGELTWQEYLERVIENPNTGSWVIDVIQQ